MAAAGPAAAAKQAPDLVARGGSAAYADGQLTLKLKFRNKGGADAGKNTGAFAVSKDKVVSDDDRGLGLVKVPAIEKGKGTTVKTTVTVPATVPSGTYYVVYCADYKTKVTESNEGNDCGSTKNSVKITPTTTPPPPTTTVTLAAVATTGGAVTASAIGGTCAGTSCTVVAGSSTVVFTPTAASGYTFTGWSGCSGYTGTAAITFTNPTANAACVAVFTATTTPPPPPTTTTVNVAFSAAKGTVTASTTAGSCTGSATASGTCVVPSGASTVTLTAVGGVVFLGWGGGTGCTSSSRTLVITNPAASVTCTANYLL